MDDEQRSGVFGEPPDLQPKHRGCESFDGGCRQLERGLAGPGWRVAKRSHHRRTHITAMRWHCCHRGLFSSLALALSAAACGQEPRNANGDPSMTTIDRQLAQLQSLIANERIVEAETLARTIGPPAVRALVPLAEHESTDVRLAVLEIAAGVQHPETC